MRGFWLSPDDSFSVIVTLIFQNCRRASMPLNGRDQQSVALALSVLELGRLWA